MRGNIPIENYIVNPLTSEELQTLQTALDRPIPEPILEVFQTIGFPQNVCHRLPDGSEELVGMQDNVGEGFFGFAHDKNERLLVCDKDGRVFRHAASADRYRDIDQTVEQFIAANLAPAERDTDLAWHVQFAFQTEDEERVLSEVADCLGLTVDTDWELVETTPAGVKSERRYLSAGSTPQVLSRLSYQGWNAPILALDFTFPPDKIRHGKHVIQRLASADVGFKLVNYGILPADLSQEDA